MAGYLIILGVAASGKGNIYIYLIPGILVLAASGMNNVLVTIFLANTVDYGQVTLGSRDESVIFSMQTFVVKLASGVAAFVASITLQFLNLSDEATTEAQQTMDMSVGVSDASRMGLRAVMTLIPIAVLIFAFIWFRKKYILTDTKMEEIAEKLGKNKN
jgi:melibiose permease